MSSPTPPPPVPPNVPPVPLPPTRRPDNRRVVILTALGLVLTLLIGLVLLLPDDDGGTSAAATPSAAPTPAATPTEATAPAQDAVSEEELQVQRDAAFAQLVRRDPADPTALGAVDAPVVMVMWADFRCGYCARFALETMPGLVSYVDDGTLRVEWRDFPRVTQQSPAIAAAAKAAGVQGRFWEFHDRVFADQATVETMADDYLRAVATELGLDVAQFDADRASADVLASVEADAAQGQAIGVTGTPAFMINGSPIAGSQPLEAYVAVIEAELARAAG